MGHNSVVLGYPNSTGIPRVDGLSMGLPGFRVSRLSSCEHCLARKIAKKKKKKKPFRKGTRAKTPLQLIHSDIYGPMNVKSKHGVIYFITFIDNFT